MKLDLFSYLAICTIVSLSMGSNGQAHERSMANSLPPLFKFHLFKDKFHKHYESPIEDLVRGKIFLARAFSVFVSYVAYKVASQDYYLSLNQMSDWTSEERQQTLIRRLHHKPDKSAGGRMPDLEEDPTLELDDLRDAIGEIESHKQEPGYRELASELEIQMRNKRQAEDGQPIGKPPNKWIKRTLKKALNSMRSLANRTRKLVKGDSLLSIDHRKGNCLGKVRDQGRCGSCYAFATVAYFEHLYCKQTGQPLEFTEQHQIDCGARLGINGCNGAPIQKAIEFIGMFGLEPRAEYPYAEQKDKCPYEGWIDPSHHGLVRPNDSTLVEIPNERLLDELAEGPLVAGVGINSRFVDYGGGVDDNVGCETEENWHAMLLVGQGRQRGKEFLLFRNSHSVHWGERGYYKLSMEAIESCELELYKPLGSFQGDGRNNLYEGAEILSRRLEDLKEQKRKSSKRRKFLNKFFAKKDPNSAVHDELYDLLKLYDANHMKSR